MKYAVRRTSDFISEDKPCKEAVRGKYTRIDERTVNDPMLIKSVRDGREKWYDRGTNHRVENGHIKRDFEDEAWFVEINTLKELNDFIDKYGDCVIMEFWENPSILCIEIYDTYRE